MECLICRSETGHDCLAFCGAVICSDCEVRLMEQTADEPGYENQVQAFRQLWQKQLLAARDRHLGDGDCM
ncbi:MAG: hypothetical protein GX251_03790 [Firmicutes bacterium]|nr:hypothetical protein [Bacillota bacterium]